MLRYRLLHGVARHRAARVFPVRGQRLAELVSSQGSSVNARNQCRIAQTSHIRITSQWESGGELMRAPSLWIFRMICAARFSGSEGPQEGPISPYGGTGSVMLSPLGPPQGPVTSCDQGRNEKHDRDEGD